MEPLTDRHYFVILRGWSSRQHEYSPPKHSHNSNTAPEHAPSFEGCRITQLHLSCLVAGVLNWTPWHGHQNYGPQLIGWSHGVYQTVCT